MKKKRTDTIVMAIVCLLMLGAVITYYYLLIRKYEILNVATLFVWILQKRIPIDTIIFDKKLQYILFTLLYVSFFVFFCKIGIVKTRISRGILSLAFSSAFALQIYISDTILNYISFHEQYKYFSNSTIGKFAISKIWGNSISEYGFGIIMINLLYLLLMLTIILRIRRIISKVDDESDGVRDKKNKHSAHNDKGTNAMVMLMLYKDDDITYRSIVDFVNSLPANDIGLSNLLLIEKKLVNLIQ